MADDPDSSKPASDSGGGWFHFDPLAMLRGGIDKLNRHHLLGILRDMAKRKDTDKSGTLSFAEMAVRVPSPPADAPEVTAFVEAQLQEMQTQLARADVPALEAALRARTDVPPEKKERLLAVWEEFRQQKDPQLARAFLRESVLANWDFFASQQANRLAHYEDKLFKNDGFQWLINFSAEKAGKLALPGINTYLAEQGLLKLDESYPSDFVAAAHPMPLDQALRANAPQVPLRTGNASAPGKPR